MIAQTNAELEEGARSWLASDRSPQADARYLERLRSAYEHALPRWPRWQRRFRTLIEDHLGMSPREIAWRNLAKCRVSIDRGSRVRAAERELTRLCQRAFPTAQLVEAIRPAAVLVAVLAGRDGGDIVATWALALVLATGLVLAGPVRPRSSQHGARGAPARRVGVREAVRRARR